MSLHVHDVNLYYLSAVMSDDGIPLVVTSSWSIKSIGGEGSEEIATILEADIVVA
jgi:hypothetical protein